MGDAQTRPLLSPSIPGGCSLHPTAQPHAGRQSPGCSLHHPILLAAPRCPRPGRPALLKGSGGGVLPGWSCPPRLPPPPHRRAGHPAQGAPALPLFSSCPRVSRGWRSWAQRFGELFSFQRLFFFCCCCFSFPPLPEFCRLVSLLCFSCGCPGYSHAISPSAKAAPERAGALGSLRTPPPAQAVPATPRHFKALPLPALWGWGPRGSPPQPGQSSGAWGRAGEGVAQGTMNHLGCLLLLFLPPHQLCPPAVPLQSL